MKFDLISFTVSLWLGLVTGEQKIWPMNKVNLKDKKSHSNKSWNFKRKEFRGGETKFLVQPCPRFPMNNLDHQFELGTCIDQRLLEHNHFSICPRYSWKRVMCQVYFRPKVSENLLVTWLKIHDRPTNLIKSEDENMSKYLIYTRDMSQCIYMTPPVCHSNHSVPSLCHHNFHNFLNKIINSS